MGMKVFIGDGVLDTGRTIYKIGTINTAATEAQERQLEKQFE